MTKPETASGLSGDLPGAAPETLVLALPKGRILKAIRPILAHAGIEPEPDFFDESDRRLRFRTEAEGVDVIRVRSFDVATFLAFGAAHMGVAGSDVLMEFDHPEIYAPVDLGVGRCRMVVASQQETLDQEDPRSWSHVRVATKYPGVTRRHFASRGVQAECIKLNGAMELAPGLGLCRRIVDLVETGSTLVANGLVEVEEIAQISSRFAVNRAAWKTRPDDINHWVTRIREAVNALQA
ncbi:MAG: ATP phosphoribosyltransferase [SAR116 cluster bacterium MED-G04]|jgi:ATP phosphoribosyltransferase|nr:MAG: ATP phosphoribosyltransferase [SAR116 cluster bacterium MED-G04]CAI8395776.1 MAG: ATP phosphoribosyltransferase [SAR116 cluster bacterium MED-G04]HCD49454.1 ATP phosphoribosyltransferase [Alphaproteobacteria bacterium]HCV61979.1 ATP phosphoribosyltransferase [Alphaproteobacteria bacterium]|tara:strand:- start:3213 stop:3926 length:714 start_codon:yes stop_codon:yes gene_type:complete